MDPITAGIGAIGLGMSLYGGISGSNTSSKIAQNEQEQFGLQQQVNTQRRNAMELSARRQQLETFRNTQRQRAMGLNAAVGQGAQYGSGLAGGQADTTNQGLFASAGINQNLAIGRNIFSLDDKITGLKSQEAGLKSDLATDQSWMSMGGAVMANAGTIGKVANYGFGAASNAATSASWLSGGPTGFLRS